MPVDKKRGIRGGKLAHRGTNRDVRLIVCENGGRGTRKKKQE